MNITFLLTFCTIFKLKYRRNLKIQEKISQDYQIWKENIKGNGEGLMRVSLYIMIDVVVNRKDEEKLSCNLRC